MNKKEQELLDKWARTFWKRLSPDVKFKDWKDLLTHYRPVHLDGAPFDVEKFSKFAVKQLQGQSK